jgi:hypothetical protein
MEHIKPLLSDPMLREQTAEPYQFQNPRMECSAEAARESSRKLHEGEINLNVLGIEPPYLIALTGGKSEIDEYVHRTMDSATRLVVKTLNGRRMKDWPSTMDEMAAELEFPSYFGKNIPAFSECLQDLEWLPADAYSFLLYDAASVLSKETHADAISFFSLLDRICSEWAVGTLPGANWERKRTPFHIFLCGNSGDVEKLIRRLQPEIALPVINVPKSMQIG